MADLLGSQTPRIWTPRQDGTSSLGPLMGAIAELAGLSLLEWEALVLDIAAEVVAGKWTRRGLTLLVARQNGKTLILLVRILAGLFAVATDRLILHTAQDRAVPRELFDELVQIIEAVPDFRRQIPRGGIREANGQERIRLRDGSTYRILAPRAKAFRTWSADLLIFDEAREQRDSTLWGAALPTQRTRPNPQWWAVSNAGDPGSVVLNDLRDRGRAASDDPGSDPSVGYLEWSAREDRELDDRDGWVEANPSLGLLLDETAIVEEMRSLSEDAFRTEILCQWVETLGEPAIPWDRWLACGDTPPTVPAGTRCWMAFDVDPERTSAVLVAAAWIGERLVVSVVEEWTDPDGIDERAIADDVRAWIREWKPRVTGYDPWTSAGIASTLERRPVRIEKISGVDFTTACSQLWDAVASGTLNHDSNPGLMRQIGAATRRDSGDGGWRITRAHSTEPIPAVMAIARVVYLAYRPQAKAALHASK